MELLADLGNQVDAIVTDPPYHLSSVVKRFSKSGGADRPPSRVGAYNRHARGFMGKEWDGGNIAQRPETWTPALALLKPGGYLLAFGGSRTFARMAVAIEDAGFIQHPLIAWVYGQGFPKAHNPKVNGYEGWRHGGQALKPAIEPIFMGQKPMIGTGRENILMHGTGAVNIDGCRVHAEDAKGAAYTVKRFKPGATLLATGGTWKDHDGPDYVGHTQDGRWPANVIHDGSDEVLTAFPAAPGQIADASTSSSSGKTQNVYGAMRRGNGREGEASANRRYTENGASNFAALPGQRRNDSGSAARFFYCAKASKAERDGSKHPTVKPLALMRYLVRLVTPPGGTVLDPFAGTGTTGEAAAAEGFSAILIEREAEYVADIRRRLTSF